MKTFISALLFASASAANWSTSGTKISAGKLTLTPKIATSWTIAGSKMTTTWTTTGTLSKKLEKDDEAQVWWCVDDSCVLWQWKQNSLESKVRVYQGATSFTAKNDSNVKDQLEKLYTAKTSCDFKGTTPGTKTEKSFWRIGTANNKANALSVSGTTKIEQTAADTTTYSKSGRTWKGKLGAYLKDKSEDKKKGSWKSTDIKIAKKATTTASTKPQVKNGAKKTWTGPSVTVDAQTVKAGGNTQWKRDIPADRKTSTLTQWTCQTATATTALSSKMTAQVFLWDKTVGKTAHLWQFKKDEIKYVAVSGIPTDAEIEKEKNPKEQMDSFTNVSKVQVKKSGTTWAVDSSDNKNPSGQSVDIAQIKDTSDKNWTGCYKTVNAKGSNTKYKGSTKAYQQGVWYSKDSADTGSKLATAPVSVIFSTEGANGLMTALGAVAMGVAALAF